MIIGLKTVTYLMIFGVADLYIFFYHAIPPEGDAISLENVHGLVTDVWLSRHDADLASEQAQRRKGRPKSAKEMKLEELKLREAEEYRTGLGAYFLISVLFFCRAHLEPLQR